MQFIALAALLSLPHQSGAQVDLAVTPATDVVIKVSMLEVPAGPGSSLPNMTCGQDKRVYLSWMEPVDGGEIAMRFSVFEADSWSEAREITRGNDFFMNWADFPSLAATSSGALMAHWLRSDGTPHGYMAEFSLSTDAGETWSPPAILHTDESSAEHGFVSIAPLDEETFAAIWLDGRSMADPLAKQKQTDLYFRTISQSGELGIEQVIDSRVCDCCQTSLIAIDEGQLLAAYRDRDSDEIRDITSISFDGKQWSEAKIVFEDGWLIQGCPVNGPALLDQDGRQSVIWFTGAGEGGGQVKFASRDGTAPAFGYPTRLDDGSPIGRVDLASCGNQVLASWLEHTESSFAEWRVRPIGPRAEPGPALSLGKVSADRQSGFLRMAPHGNDCLAAWAVTGEEPAIVTARLRVVR